MLCCFSPQKALTSQTITKSKDHLPLAYTSVLVIILTLPSQMKQHVLSIQSLDSFFKYTVGLVNNLDDHGAFAQ